MLYKRLIFALLLLAMLPSLALADYAAEAKNPIYGFRGIKWGEPASKYKNELERAYTSFDNPKSVVYIRPYEKPSIGGAYIGHFEYCFDEKGFYQAIAMMDYSPSGKNKNSDPQSPKSYSDLKNRFLKSTMLA